MNAPTDVTRRSIRERNISTAYFCIVWCPATSKITSGFVLMKSSKSEVIIDLLSDRSALGFFTNIAGISISPSHYRATIFSTSTPIAPRPIRPNSASLNSFPERSISHNACHFLPCAVLKLLTFCLSTVLSLQDHLSAVPYVVLLPF